MNLTLQLVTYKLRGQKESVSHVTLRGGRRGRGQEDTKNKEADFSQIWEMIVEQHKMPPSSESAPP